MFAQSTSYANAPQSTLCVLLFYEKVITVGVGITSFLVRNDNYYLYCVAGTDFYLITLNVIFSALYAGSPGNFMSPSEYPHVAMSLFLSIRIRSRPTMFHAGNAL